MNDLIKQIKTTLKPLPPFKKVIVALSGGMDSVAVTHALKHLGYEVIVAHLNHQLRVGASDIDEQFAINLAKKWKLPYMTQKAVIPRKGNLEKNARKIRYCFLEDVREAYKADHIVTGHHFDDQIETVLMHEKRGSGYRGKRGMRLVNGKLLRPMLEVDRTTIEAYIKEHKLEYRVDESNFDLTFERNHLRHKVIPKLKEDPTFKNSIRKKIKDAKAKLKELGKQKDAWLKTNYKNERLDRHEFNALEKDLKVEILIHLLGQKDVYSSTLGTIINFIATGKTGKEIVVKGILFVIEYDRIRCISEEQSKMKKTKVKDETKWGNYTIKVSNIKPLYVRSWKDGDKFNPTGMKGTKKVQDFFVDAKIPKYDRKQIPIVVDENDDIICIGNMRFAEKHKHLKEKISIDEK